MKKSFILMFSLLALFSTSILAQNSVFDADINIKTYKLDKKTHQFGDVEMGKRVVAEFIITNTSTSESLILKNVKPSCGCTATGYSKEPIAPGESTTIKATFTGSGVGNFSKTIAVQSNFSDAPEILHLKGKVIPKAAKSSKTVKQ